MFLTKVAPLSKIPRPAPQFLTYFTSKKIKRGALVLVPLRKKKVKAIVFAQKEAINLKLEIKKTQYQIKPIAKIIETEPVINEKQIELAKWMADYYWSSFGKVLSLFLKKQKKKIKNTLPQKKSFSKKLIIAPNNFCPKEEIKKALFEKKEVLFLVPEKTKENFWKKKLKEFKSENLIIGTRSKLFLPFSNLGLIVLTEEGNKNYKSQMEPRYNATKVAEKLAKIWQARLILISNFPSPETYFSTKEKEKTKEESNIKKTIIDMRKIKPWKPLSDHLITSIKNHLQANEKILLVINRKGSATTLFCQDCGWVKKCQDCNLPLTYHQEESPKLICHYCAKEYEVPKLCENCKSWNLKTLGVGIQKVEKELKNIFWEKNIFCLYKKEKKDKAKQEEMIENFLNSKSSILLTTSLFLSYPVFEKFPLVGVISLDALLSQPDFKIEEEGARIISSLLSLCKKEFIIQTFFPKSNAIFWLKKAKNYFYDEIIKERKKFDYPPFSFLIKISIIHKNREKIIKESFAFKEKIKEKFSQKELEILGPSPAFIEKVKGKYHWKLLIKLKKDDRKIKTALLALTPPHFKVDIDPERII